LASLLGASTSCGVLGAARRAASITVPMKRLVALSISTESWICILTRIIDVWVVKVESEFSRGSNMAHVQ